MATVGELLKKTRLEKEIELSDVERETRIRSSFIKALEEGDYSKLPSPAYARGFLKNYVQLLGLDTQMVLALFRREFDSQQEAKLLPGRLSQIPPRSIRITFVTLVLVLLFVGFLSFFFFQYKGFLTSPPLQVNSPSQNEVVQEDMITVAGKTDPDATIVINDKVVALTPDGSFAEIIPVFKGDFTITVVAKNRLGRETKLTRVVNVK